MHIANRILANGIIGLGLAAFLLCAAPTVALAQGGGGAVINVIGIDTDGDLPKFLKVVEQARKINARLGIQATSRVWQATFAGQDNGDVAIVVEYSSLAALADGQAKQAADAEWTKMIAEFNKTMSATSSAVWAERK